MNVRVSLLFSIVLLTINASAEEVNISGADVSLTETSVAINLNLIQTQKGVDVRYSDIIYTESTGKPNVDSTTTNGSVNVRYSDGIYNTELNKPGVSLNLIQTQKGVDVRYSDISLSENLQKTTIQTQKHSKLVRVLYADKTVTKNLEPMSEYVMPCPSFIYTTSGLNTEFSSTSVDPDGYIVSQQWNFGDGYISMEESPSHTYPMSGEYTVTLSVMDNNGHISTHKEKITIGSAFNKIECPQNIVQGLPLSIHVITEEEANIGVEIGSFTQQKYGKDITFSIDTSSLEPKAYTITITADSEETKRNVNLLDATNFKITQELDDLESACQDEMDEVSAHVGGQTYNTIIKYVDDLDGDRESCPSEMMQDVSNEADTLHSIVSQYDEVLADDMSESTKEYVKTLKTTLEYIANPDYVVRDAVYSFYFEEKYNEINERTGEAKNLLVTDPELAKKYVAIGREAIRNSEDTPVYDIDLGGVARMNPHTNYLYKKNDKAMNCKYLGYLITPWDLVDVVWADINGIMAFSGVGSTQPEQVDSATVAIATAIYKYIKVSNTIIDASPAIITAGIHYSAHWDSNYINETHLNVIEAVESKASQSAELSNDVLYLKEGSVAVTVAPNGRIAGFDYIKEDLTMTADEGTRVVVYSTEPQEFQFDSQSTNASLNISMDKRKFNLSEKVNLTVNLTNEQSLTGVLFTFIGNHTFKEFINSSTEFDYNLTPNSTGIYKVKSYFMGDGERITDASDTFSVGLETVESATLSVNSKKYYDPGEVEVDVEVKNTGDVPLNLSLDSYPLSFNLTPGEIKNDTLSIPISEPEDYDIPFYLKMGEEQLDSDVTQFTVRGLDTIFAQPETDKSVYAVGDYAAISVNVYNLTQEVDFSANITLKTPSGEMLSVEDNESIYLDEEGTYSVKATPEVPEGYFTSSDDTTFVVGNQSKLCFNYSYEGGMELVVTTDEGGVVEGAKVSVNGRTKYTDEEGFVSFDVNEATLSVAIDKPGYDPALSMIYLLKADFTYSPDNPMTNQSINFSSTSSSLGKISQYEWDFGDGNTSGSPFTNHSYSTPASYQVNLTVRGDNLTDSKSKMLPVGCGDVNCDGARDISDVIKLLYFVGYPGQYDLCSEWAGDVTGDESIDISDVIRLLYYVGYPGQYELECKC